VPRAEAARRGCNAQHTFARRAVSSSVREGGRYPPRRTEDAIPSSATAKATEQEPARRQRYEGNGEAEAPSFPVRITGTHPSRKLAATKAKSGPPIRKGVPYEGNGRMAG